MCHVSCVQSVSLDGMVLERGCKSGDDGCFTVKSPMKKVCDLSLLVHQHKTSCVVKLTTRIPAFCAGLTVFGDRTRFGQAEMQSAVETCQRCVCRGMSTVVTYVCSFDHIVFSAVLVCTLPPSPLTLCTHVVHCQVLSE